MSYRLSIRRRHSGADARRRQASDSATSPVETVLADVLNDRRGSEEVDREPVMNALADLRRADVDQRRFDHPLPQLAKRLRQRLPIERPPGTGDDDEMDLFQQRGRF